MYVRSKEWQTTAKVLVFETSELKTSEVLKKKASEYETKEWKTFCDGDGESKSEGSRQVFAFYHVFDLIS